MPGYYPPQNIKVIGITESSVTLTWEFHPLCFRRTKLWVEVNGARRAVHKNAVEFDLTGLTPKTAYTVFMITVYQGGESSDRAEVTFTTNGCPGCKQLSDDLDMEGPVITLNKTLDEFGKNMNTFKEAMSAVMNWKGGYVVIHATNPRCLEGFDHKADAYLNNTIPEGSFYHDHFRRHITEDGKHVVYNIKPQPANRPLICVNGNSRVPLNVGTQDITHAQLHGILQRILEKPNEERMDRHLIPDRRDQFMSELKEDKEITCGNVPFQENIFIQAKRSHEDDKKKNKGNTGLFRVDDANSLVSDYLFPSDVHHYISAFSKLDGGGSFYFGVAEHKKDKQFRCNGFLFPEKQKTVIERTLLEKMKEEMLWVGTSPHINPLTVKLHPVEPKTNDAQQEPQHPKQQPQEHEPMNQVATVAPGCTGTAPAHGNEQPKLYILEVKVHHYQHGAVFHTKDGPAIFRYEEQSRSARKQELDEWLIRFNETGQNICKQEFHLFSSSATTERFCCLSAGCCHLRDATTRSSAE